MEKLKVGVIGLGMMGTFHSKIYESLANVDFVGGYDVIPASAEKYAKNTGFKTFKTLDELLSKVDAVSICTPDTLHKDVTLQAFKANVKCLVEKPLSTSVSDCEEMIAACPDPSYLMVGHELRFDPRVWDAKYALDAGKIGKIQTINIWRHNSRASGQRICQKSTAAWFLGIHDIDIVLFLTGDKVKTVSAFGKCCYTPNYDYVVSTLEMESGALVTMSNSFILPDKRFTTMDGGFKIIGDQGMLEVNMNHNGVRLTSDENNRSVMLDTYHWPLIDGAHYGDLRIELESFVESCVSGEETKIPGRVALESVKVMERVHASLAERASK